MKLWDDCESIGEIVARMRNTAKIVRRWIDDPPKGVSRESYMAVLADDWERCAERIEALKGRSE